MAAGDLDLYGIACYHPRCVKKRIDTIIQRTWHYFDHVIVHAPNPAYLNFSKGLKEFERARELALGEVDITLYIRDIGAESFVRVINAHPNYCVAHMEEHAYNASMEDPSEMIESLTEILSVGYRFRKLQRKKGVWRYVYTHDSYPTVAAGKVAVGSARTEADLVHGIARRLAVKQASYLIGDVALSREYHAAMGITSQYAVGQPAAGSSVDAGSVAFNLVLPIPESMSSKDLLLMRDYEYDDFQAFRIALKTAMQERIAATEGTDAESIAEGVLFDVVMPAISRLDQMMNRAAAAAVRSGSAAAVVGGAATMVGALALAPLVVPGVVIAAGGGSHCLVQVL
ncbi:MAG: hypothetical protein WKF57_21400 [Nakamurella sp.]